MLLRSICAEDDKKVQSKYSDVDYTLKVEFYEGIHCENEFERHQFIGKSSRRGLAMI